MPSEKKEKKSKKEEDSAEKEPVKDKKDKKEKKAKRKPTPLVCTVLKISPVPKKDKLRICEVRTSMGEEGDDIDVTVVTNAENVCVGGKFIIALPGVTTANGIEVDVREVGGVESTGMFCGPKEMGWDTDLLAEDKAVQLDDEAEKGTVPTYEDAVKAFQERAKQEAAKAEASAKADAKNSKKGKKGKTAAGDEEDLDALLEEAGLEVQEVKPDAKKKGKKGKADAKTQDDDDEFLDGFVVEANAPAAAEAATASAATQQAAEDATAVEEDAKTIANRKKKEKLKAAKAKAKQAGAGLFGEDKTENADEDAAEEDKAAAAPEQAAAAPEKATGKKGAAPKKESAAVKAARERMEAQRALDEEKAAFEAAEKARIEEEERLEREEEERAEAERQRKRDARQAKIDKQKAEGTYLTKVQKQKLARAAQLREQFGFDLNELNEDEGGDEAADAKPAAKKSSLATGKKKKHLQKKESEEQSEEPAIAEVATKAESPKQQPAPAPEAKDEESDGEDWEAAAEKAEEEDAEKAKKAAAKREEEGSDGEEGSGSGSGSSSSSDSDSDSDSSEFEGYRSPIVVIMGHVDTGKTKLLDKIRRTNVQEGEAGGITQQIGATFFPDIALEEQTKKVNPNFELELPGMMIIDTPGHEAFNNLRKRGSSLCDFAILVIDIMHGLEPQTVESLNMLRERKCPFIIALNKIDVCYQWKSEHYTCIRDALQRQGDSVQQEFRSRLENVLLQLNERGLNCGLYWENQDIKSTVSIVPTSALTGEGVPDLLYVLLNLSQRLMGPQLEVSNDFQCTVIEVKNIEGHGTTIDVILVGGTLHEGDQIVVAGMGGPIHTTIRALLTPAPMKEMRVKGEYIHHAKIDVSMGVKISAPNLEDAVAGTELKVYDPNDPDQDLEEIKEEVQDGFDSILNGLEKEPSGVYVKTSTLGSLEALLSFLRDMKIPVFDVAIGEVSKKDVKRAMIMKEKGFPEYAVILAFDIKVSNDATAEANTSGVQIMTADIIYHLFDKFTAYMNQIKESKKSETRLEAVFPAMLEIQKQCIFHRKAPFIFGCKVLGGQLRPGTPICIPDKDFLEIGRVASIEKDKKPVTSARRGDDVCVKIEANTSQSHLEYGRHFDHTNKMYSKISRSSIDTLKEHFKDEMKKEDWELIIGMKTLFKIQ